MKQTAWDRHSVTDKEDDVLASFAEAALGLVALCCALTFVVIVFSI